MDSKKPWQSKTIIMNAVLGVLMAVAAFFPQAGALAQWINAHAVQIGVVWGFLGVGLRMISSGKIQLSE